MPRQFKTLLKLFALSCVACALLACGGGGNATPVNTAPTAKAGSVNGSFKPSMTFSLASQITDAETPSNMTIILVQTPSKGTVTFSGATANATYSMNSGETGDDFFTFKVRDPSGAESSIVRQDLISFDNF